jgi:hypothetical protein
MSTDANKLERIQQKSAAFCYNRFFPQVSYNFTYTLQKSLHNLSKRKCKLDALLLSQVYRGYNFGPSLLEKVVFPSSFSIY